jgi:hypothetical protein
MSDRSEKVKDGLPIRTEEILRDVELRTADSCTHDPMGREGNERPSYGTTPFVVSSRNGNSPNVR